MAVWRLFGRGIVIDVAEDLCGRFGIVVPLARDDYTAGRLVTGHTVSSLRHHHHAGTCPEHLSGDDDDYGQDGEGRSTAIVFWSDGRLGFLRGAADAGIRCISRPRPARTIGSARLFGRVDTEPR